MIATIEIISLIAASCSISASITVLWLAFLIHRHEASRPYLERFSIRILLHFAGVSLISNIASILSLTTENSDMCTVSAYLLALTLGIINCLAAAISLNIFVVLCTKLGNLNAYYCIATIWMVCLCLTTPALGLGYFGRDPERRK